MGIPGDYSGVGENVPLKLARDAEVQAFADAKRERPDLIAAVYPELARIATLFDRELKAGIRSMNGSHNSRDQVHATKLNELRELIEIELTELGLQSMIDYEPASTIAPIPHDPDKPRMNQ